jgi:hypothetical protein
MNPDQITRQQLVNLLLKPQAHMLFEDAVANFPEAQINGRVPHYRELNFPDDLWPAREAETDATGWRQTIEQFLADRQTLVAIVQDPETDLYAQIPHGGEGHSILREILIVADHNAYHVGELGVLRQVLGLW